MLNIKKVLKALRIINSVDQTKAIEITVNNAATTGTKTTLQSSQTADRVITLPDATTTLIDTDSAQNLTNKTVSLSNTTDDKLLLSEASTHKIVDSSITHTTSANDTTLSVGTKELILDGKAIRVPVKTFAPGTPPTGNAGDIIYNTTTSTFWINQAGTYIELVVAAGSANVTLSNLVSPVAINESLLPNADLNLDLGSPSFRWDVVHTSDVVATGDADVGNDLDVNNDVSVGNDLTVTGNVGITSNLTVQGNLTVNGTTTTIDTINLVVKDPNITINSGGNDATAQGAGITVQRTGTSGSLIYDSALASKWKLGNFGTESEVLSANTDQTISGIKTINKPLELSQAEAVYTLGTLTLACSAPVNTISSPLSGNVGKITTGQNASSISLYNNSGSAVTLINKVAGGTVDFEIYVPEQVNYILASGKMIQLQIITVGGLKRLVPQVRVDSSRIGMIEQFAGNITQIPTGYLYCNGSALSTTIYADLYSKIGDNWKKYNQTLAPGTFVIPDLRAKFLRGAVEYYAVTGAAFGFSLPTTIPSQTIGGASWAPVQVGDAVYVSGGGIAAGYYFIDPITNPGQFSIYPTLDACYAQSGAIVFTATGLISISFEADKSRATRYGSTVSTPTTSTDNFVGSLQAQAIQAHTHTVLGASNSNWAGGGNAGPFFNNFSQQSGSSGGLETRPDNVSVTYIIKVLPDYL